MSFLNKPPPPSKISITWGQCSLRTAKMSLKFLKVVQFDRSHCTTQWQMWSGRVLRLSLHLTQKIGLRIFMSPSLENSRESLSWPSYDPSCSTHGQTATPYCKNATRWPPYPLTGWLCGYGLTGWRPLWSILCWHKQCRQLQYQIQTDKKRKEPEGKDFSFVGFFMIIIKKEKKNPVWTQREEGFIWNVFVPQRNTIRPKSPVWLHCC